MELAAAIHIFRHPGALNVAATAAGFSGQGTSVLAKWLDGRPRAGKGALGAEDVQLLRESADRIWRFFHDWSSSSFNWLIPDSVKENGTVDLRLSPTNLGMLLNARIAAVHLGVMPLGEFIFETQQTLDQVFRKLQKYRGHLYNWYDITTLEPIAPRFVSTVDSGNLAASLWTLKQAALAMAGESVVKRGVTREMSEELRTLAEQCDRLVREMDFGFLYRRRRKEISIGYDVTAGKLHSASYNLLASEARIAAFVAIAKGDIPQESWFLLDRAHTMRNGEHVLLSWSGTMFEYLMPALWMRHYPDTMLDKAMNAVVRTQRDYAAAAGSAVGNFGVGISGRDGRRIRLQGVRDSGPIDGQERYERAGDFTLFDVSRRRHRPGSGAGESAADAEVRMAGAVRILRSHRLFAGGRRGGSHVDGAPSGDESAGDRESAVR